jgi:predicted metalloprotease with PDZ domain
MMFPQVFRSTLTCALILIGSSTASTGRNFVNAVLPGGAAQEAGVRAGDQLLALGDLPVGSPEFGPAFRARYGKEEGVACRSKFAAGVRLASRVERRIEAEPAVSPKAVRVRNGILKGSTGW